MVIKLVRKLLTSRLGFLAAGAAAMYLWDPDRGRSRRADLQERAGELPRRMWLNVTHQAEMQDQNFIERLDGVMTEAG